MAGIGMGRDDPGLTNQELWALPVRRLILGTWDSASSMHRS